MAKTTRVVMPQLGESVHEGTISKWLVKVGDKVVEFEPMLEVDTDKVNAEVPAPVTGILREILAKEGETVQAGAEIAVVELGSEGSDGKAQEAEVVPAPSSREGAAEKAPPAVAEEAPVVAAKEAPAPTLETGEHRYSPAVQMQASELKVDLSKVAGTGIGGRVTK
jgi:2-oxoisovalerate dehydrogenase E2 component (dihydrolipoyl transacylase)